MAKSWNWRLWVGFLIAFVASPFYFSSYDRIAGAFWISVACFVVASAMLAGGLRRAYAQPAVYRGKVAGPILGVLTLCFVGLFAFGIAMKGQAYSKGLNSPRVGDKAPEIALTDTGGHKVTMAQLLTTPLAGAAAHPTRGVLLVFYRGWW